MRFEGMPALGSATRPLSIMDLKMFPWDRRMPRFYLPDEHPATYRWRQQRAQVLRLFDKRPTREGFEMLAYIEDVLARFEAGEDEAKRIAWARLRDRERPRTAHGESK